MAKNEALKLKSDLEKGGQKEESKNRNNKVKKGPKYKKENLQRKFEEMSSLSKYENTKNKSGLHDVD